jgi:arylsulfatase A-like enzyme
VLASLEENGLSDNTIVIFTSDNGGANYLGLPDLNKPYSGWKMTLFEGGIRTPFFIRWPEKIAAGSQYNSPVAHIDIFSTVLAAAGIEPPESRVIDGRDILAVALDPEQPPLDRPLYWRSGGYKVVQQDGRASRPLHGFISRKGSRNTVKATFFMFFYGRQDSDNFENSFQVWPVRSRVISPGE